MVSQLGHAPRSYKEDLDKVSFYSTFTEDDLSKTPTMPSTGPRCGLFHRHCQLFELCQPEWNVTYLLMSSYVWTLPWWAAIWGFPGNRTRGCHSGMPRVSDEPAGANVSSSWRICNALDVRSSDPTVDTNRIAFSITCPTRSRTGELRRSCSPADIEPGVTRINGQEFCIPYQRRFYSDMPLSATQRDDPCIMPLVDPLMH
ncbi:hypothetical protein BKA82DRAFT_588942 [Pisolithus tinctorius]|uniref:Uncharacterized protein n=1 Tax=Pisolithus tinctorius Marx 270 TaxID=870435 RepID=A0A0C3PXC0_PISTI|nr:hypothetical protein BKA82DRAFT_588942 [Pisolithus tinctorius]KIO13624.1 hypothetical protein M404DRAFT_588942 [Pisolithus tinctorius Marx 270]